MPALGIFFPYAIFALFLMVAAVFDGPAGAATLADSDLCRSQADRVERQRGLPTHLLSAIAVVETGRSVNGVRSPWPWTINADGQGLFFASKAEAIAAARALKRAGADNLDVGCMQISLKHHPAAFPDLETAFDPAANVEYGGRFLSSLIAAHGGTAVGRYHSATPELLREYQSRVEGVWRRLANGQPLLVAWSAPATFLPTPLPDYPDKSARHLGPIQARAYFQSAMADAPGNSQAAFGWALATERMARLHLLPYATARVAYAQALRADRGNKVALGRLFELVADETPERQLELLQQAFLISGGPAELARQLAQLASSQGHAEQADHFRQQAQQLRAMGESAQVRR